MENETAKPFHFVKGWVEIRPRLRQGLQRAVWRQFCGVSLPVQALCPTIRLQDFHLRCATHVRRSGGVDGTHDTGRDQQGGKGDGKADSQSFFDHDVLLSIINLWTG